MSAPVAAPAAADRAHHMLPASKPMTEATQSTAATAMLWVFGALTAFFWAGLVRMALLHRVTWSVNSICHVVGERPFNSKDKAINFWPLAILSFGESWHNSHHADPTGARHGVLREEIDPGARLIWIFEKLGWASDVRWPNPVRLTAKRTEGSAVVLRKTA